MQRQQPLTAGRSHLRQAKLYILCPVQLAVDPF